MSVFPRCFVAVVLVGGLLLSGCASVTPRKVVGNPGAAPLALPTHIYVQNFSAPDGNLRVDRSGQELVDFKAALAQELSGSLATKLTEKLAPASVIQEGQMPPSGNVWLITGRFDRVDQGSRALRATVGFGLGATKVVATSEVYDLSSGKPVFLMSIQTSGGSNAMPGTVINMAPMVAMGPVTAVGVAGVVAGGGTSAIPGLGADLKRTAHEVTAVLSDYCYRRGLIFKKDAMKPKLPGGL